MDAERPESAAIWRAARRRWPWLATVGLCSIVSVVCAVSSIVDTGGRNVALWALLVFVLVGDGVSWCLMWRATRNYAMADTYRSEESQDGR